MEEGIERANGVAPDQKLERGMEKKGEGRPLEKIDNFYIFQSPTSDNCKRKVQLI